LNVVKIATLIYFMMLKASIMFLALNGILLRASGMFLSGITYCSPHQVCFWPGVA
jgi:hypothetical protein